MAWADLFWGKGTCFCPTGSPDQEQAATGGTDGPTVTCVWITFFVGKLLEYHSSLHHKQSIHQQVIHHTSAAKQTIAIK